MTKSVQKQRTFTRNNFAEHNYNYVNRPQSSTPFTLKYSKSFFLQRQNCQQPTTTSVNVHEYPRTSEDQNENYPFFQQKKKQNQNKH